MKLVLIEWSDANANDEWTKLRALKEQCGPVPCKSVGWLVSEKNGYKMIVPHLAGDDRKGYDRHGCGDINIPEGVITKITVLRES
ncbi:MAG: hypothetical protein IIA99_06500 [Proteobacteria bacterium]|nr:hypothetical protein [Pseudomonadota bacterium]